MASKQYSRECPMARKTRSRGVDDMCQVNTGEELLDQLLPQLTFHEGIGRNHADVTCTMAVLWCLSQGEKPLDERENQRVSSVTSMIELAISRIQLSIFDRNVRRVPHHDMVLLPQDALQLLRLLQSIDRRCPALL